MWLFLTKPYKWPISFLVQGKGGWFGGGTGGNSPCGTVSRPLIGGLSKSAPKSGPKSEP